MFNNILFMCVILPVSLLACNTQRLQIPATETSAPTEWFAVNTAAPVDTPVSTKTMGTPIPFWDDLPVMPGATEGRPAGFSYVYSVSVSLDEAEVYYQEEMKAAGWEVENRKESETSMFGGPAIILDFVRGGEKVNIMLIFSTSENYTMVMLTVIK
jgi:hypothetical protein